MAENHKEIERIWILPNMPAPKVLVNNTTGIRTSSIPHLISYIFSDFNGEMRVVKREIDTGNKYSITVKSRGDMVRDEWEDTNIPEWVYNIVEPNAICEVFKTRHFVDYQSYILEIDEYHHRASNREASGIYHDYAELVGKIRLECEFSSEQEANDFELPEWASGAKEVTTDHRYKNSYLAQHGWPKGD